MQAALKGVEAGNTAFNPVEYIDVLHAAGHKLMVYFRDGVPDGLFEELPRRRLTKAENAAFMKVRWKFVRASSAVERVMQECLRRGLVA
jgi:hypothetical protein